MIGPRVALALLLVVSVGGALAADREPLSSRSVPSLVKDLDHPNPGVRIEAVDELGRRKDVRGLIPLLGRLRDDVPEVRAHSAEALRALGDERAVPFLARTLEDRDETVRCRALLAMGELAGKYVLPTVRRMLEDPSVLVRASAVRALGEIGDPLSLEWILETLRKGDPSADRALASSGIIAAAKVGGTKGFSAALRIVEADLPESWFLRASAAHAAGLTADDAHVPFLEAALGEDRDPRVCQAAAGALAGLGKLDPILDALSSKEPFRRQAAVGALGRFKEPEARAALLRATRDESPGVVLSAAASLVESGETEALPVLIGLLEGGAQIWLAALEILEMRTGMDFGRNPPRWTEWFRQNRDRLVFDPATGMYRVGG